MSDTDEYPAIKPPVPPAELWAVWNATRGEWERRNGSSYRLHCFPLEILAAGYARAISGPDVYVPVRLIPPTP